MSRIPARMVEKMMMVDHFLELRGMVFSLHVLSLR
jgi:hypothetical protein